MTLLDSENPNSSTMGKYCFAGLFDGCTKLTKAPSLPATTLVDGCYYYMFADCQSLVNAPALPATTLADFCYWGMFSGCTALTQAPVLNATTLTDYCYQNMFAGCTSLATAPLLPATVLGVSCYSEMFSGCTSLTTVGKIHMTDFGGFEKTGGLDYMFADCTSLWVEELENEEGAENVDGVFLLPFTDDDNFLDIFSGCNKIGFTESFANHYYKYVIK